MGAAVLLACGSESAFSGFAPPPGGSAGAATQGGSSASGGALSGGAANAGGTLSSGGSAGSAVNASGAGGAAGCPRACGPTYDQFFDLKKLATLRVNLPSAPPAFSAADHCAPFSWTSARMTYESPDGLGNVTLENVGFRHRGSRSQPVQGFKLDLQVLDTPGVAGKRRFADLNRVNILSNEGDHTHILQCVGYRAFSAFGIPAPRCNLLKVYVNDQYYGLLENVEQVNRGFLRRHFGTNTGSLYGASMSNDGGTKSGAACTGVFKDSLAKLEYAGDTFSSYANQYQLTSATAAEAEQNLIPMLKCGASATDAEFQACIGDWLDVSEWLKVIAVESILPEMQSFIGYYRNYYLYFRADASSIHKGRFVVWPWDIDTSMNRGKCSPSSCNVLTSVDPSYIGLRAKLVTRLTTVFRAEYCAHMTSFLATVFKPSLVDELARVAEPGMADDPTDTTTAFQTAVSALSTYVTTQTAVAQASIAANCQ